MTDTRQFLEGIDNAVLVRTFKTDHQHTVDIYELLDTNNRPYVRGNFGYECHDCVGKYAMQDGFSSALDAEDAVTEFHDWDDES